MSDKDDVLNRLRVLRWTVKDEMGEDSANIIRDGVLEIEQLGLVADRLRVWWREDTAARKASMREIRDELGKIAPAHFKKAAKVQELAAEKAYYLADNIVRGDTP